MNEQDLYHRWLTHKKSVAVPDGFSEQVMRAIHQSCTTRSTTWWDRWVTTSLAQAGLAVAAVVAFLLRFVVLFNAAVG